MNAMSVAVRKYIRALVALSLADSPLSPSLDSFSGTASTDTICAIDGRTPATACPVMIACIYLGFPNPAAKAKAPF